MNIMSNNKILQKSPYTLGTRKIDYIPRIPTVDWGAEGIPKIGTHRRAVKFILFPTYEYSKLFQDLSNLPTINIFYR